eukprot:EG_transcript_5197
MDDGPVPATPKRLLSLPDSPPEQKRPRLSLWGALCFPFARMTTWIRGGTAVPGLVENGRVDDDGEQLLTDFTPIPGAANPAEADTRLAPRVPPLALGRPPSPPPGLDVPTLADPVNGDVLPTTHPAAAAAGDDVAATSNAAQLEPPAPLPPPPAQSEGEEEVAPECPPAETATSSTGQAVGPEVYATLVVLGPREALMDQNNQLVEAFGRNNEDFVLRRKTVGNGVQLSPSTRSYLDRVAPKNATSLGLPEAGTPQREESASPYQRGNVRSITLSACKTYTHAVKFDFVEAADFDMWQVGRMEPNRNDWQIIGYHNDVDYPVSRYAFRILASRETGRCWVYAGGFDSKGDLFLNPHTIRWGAPPYDAFTTCGLLLWVPRLRRWCEVSVMGQLYDLRPSHNVGGKKLHDADLTNELLDGSLIHIGGSTILFRRGDFHMAEADDQRAVVRGLRALQITKPQCPIQIETLRFLCKAGPSRGSDNGHSSTGEGPPTPAGLASQSSDFPSGRYVPTAHLPLAFLRCGHALANTPENAALGTCPLCRRHGPSTSLRYDYHKALALGPAGEEEAPSHVFNPCGHIVTEAQVRHWCSVPVPGISNHFAGEWCTGRYACPFCNVPLDSTQPYAKLHLA